MQTMPKAECRESVGRTKGVRLSAFALKVFDAVGSDLSISRSSALEVVIRFVDAMDGPLSELLTPATWSGTPSRPQALAQSMFFERVVEKITSELGITWRDALERIAALMWRLRQQTGKTFSAILVRSQAPE